MRKPILITVLLAIIFAMTFAMAGCATEDDTTAGLSNSANVAEAEVQQLRADIDDVGFWDTLDRATGLIKESLESGRDISVSFRLTTSEGETILLEDTYLFHLAYINDTWRSLTASQIEYIVATAEQVSEAFNRGEFVKVTGLIMKWTEYVGADATPHIISVADIKADGKWDYVAEGKFYFTDSAASSIPGTETEFGAIGIIEVVPTGIVPVNSDSEASLSAMAELALQP